MKKVLIVLFTVISITFGCLALSSCTTTNPQGSNDESSNISNSQGSNDESCESDTAGIVYEIAESGEYAFVIGYSGTENDIIIADTYKGVPVTRIYNNAFKNTSITSVIIPDSVTTIGVSAFYKCSSLTSIEIGDSVTTIGIYAFAYCYDLTSIEIGDSVTSIGNAAFGDCSRLISIEVSPNNNSYKSVNGVLYTKDGATLIQYPIGKKDTSFVVPDSVTSIGSSAFSNCSSLTSIEMGGSVTSIGSGAFYGCDGLTSIEIWGSVTSIGDAAFAYCSSLTSIEIPDSVTSIGSYAFCDCSNLERIIIGSGVKTIGEGAFYNCSSLTKVYYRGSAEMWETISIGSNNSDLTENGINYYQ